MAKGFANLQKRLAAQTMQPEDACSECRVWPAGIDTSHFAALRIANSTSEFPVVLILCQLRKTGPPGFDLVCLFVLLLPRSKGSVF